MRLRDFQLWAGQSDLGVRVNRSAAYLSEAVALRLASVKLDADYGKLVISIVPSGRDHDHGLVTLVKPVCEVFVERDDPSALLGPEPTRRSAAGAVVAEAHGFLRQVSPMGADELHAVCRQAWAKPPPYRFEITRLPVKHGSQLCRVFYVFGPDLAAIELEVAELGTPIRSVAVRKAQKFESLGIWFPVHRIRSIPDGIAFVDRSGRQIDFVPLANPAPTPKRPTRAVS